MNAIALSRWGRHYRFVLLLAGLLIFLVAGPLLHDLTGQSANNLINLTFALTLVLGIWSLESSPRWFYTGIGLMVAGVACTALAIALQSTGFTLATLSFMLLFLCISTGIVGHQLFLAERISPNELAASVSIYLLLGVIWALLYLFLELLAPGAFSGLGSTAVADKLGELTYFSFVTLTTLGYGDIIPVSSTAHTLAFLEAIFGQLYIAILIAGLVALHITGRQR